MRSVCIHIGVVIIHRTKQYEVCMYTYRHIGVVIIHRTKQYEVCMYTYRSSYNTQDQAV